jgi:hypothetical protein
LPQQALLIGSQGDIGASPLAGNIIKTLRVYRNDSLKLESQSPFSALQQSQAKGPKKFDVDYTITITSSDIP